MEVKMNGLLIKVKSLKKIQKIIIKKKIQIMFIKKLFIIRKMIIYILNKKNLIQKLMIKIYHLNLI